MRTVSSFSHRRIGSPVASSNFTSHPTVIGDANPSTEKPEANLKPSFYAQHHTHNLIFTDNQNENQWRVRARSGPVEYENRKATYIQIVSYDLRRAMRNIIVMSQDKNRIDEIIAHECDRIAHMTSAEAAQEMMQYRFAITNAMDREPDVRR